MITDINSEDRLVQETFADHLNKELGWDSVYAFNSETFGPNGTLGRVSEREVVLLRDLRAALGALNPDIPEAARECAVSALTRFDYSRSLVQHNREMYGFIREGVPVEWRNEKGELQKARARVMDFRAPGNNRFLAVRELKIQGVRVPHYNRRADLVCFVNGLPLVFIELKAVYQNIRAGFDNNLTDYMSEPSIAHAFHHNAFLIVSNGEKARYGSITSRWDHFVEWKRDEERSVGRVDAETLLNGMLRKERLLDLVENFILFDDSRAGGTRKIVARNHQVLGVNSAVEAVIRQEALKLRFPDRVKPRPAYRTEEPPAVMHFDLGRPVETLPLAAEQKDRTPQERGSTDLILPLVERAHPELGRLGVFWHTQGSGKSYSMAFFAEKVRRVVPGNFTFVLMTDREDLDEQIFRTFVGCGVADEKTPRAASGDDLKTLLKENHRFIFSLIHKFNQDVKPDAPYTRRNDIIVISDEAHRTQSGKFARNMRLALPNAAFLGFTGTPIFKHDHLTRRIFGGYVSRYDFKRSEEDQSTVKLVYENQGEKLGLARLDLNERIAEKIEQAELDPNQTALLEKLLGQDYEVITADERLDKLADDFVEHCATRWQSGKSLFVCIDKITCARMFQRIRPRWDTKLAAVRRDITEQEAARAKCRDPDQTEVITKRLDFLLGQADWMAGTIIEIIISEAQNEARDFAKWGVDIVPHRVVMKTGFETDDGKRIPVDEAFKNPAHPFRVAIVCAMWLTGFDVECLSTLYIDKPMRAHNLMQAIARANRVYPGKECGVIVDYNGVLRGLREALAQYALGDGQTGSGSGTETGGGQDIVEPIQQMVQALTQALDAAEAHLKSLGFDPARLRGSKGFVRIEALKDAVDALYKSDASKRRFEIMARQIFSRFKALLMEPTVFSYAERHDNIEAVYKKLQENRNTADVTDLLKELHRIVNEAIRTQGTGADHADRLTVDLSKIDFEKLRQEFENRVPRKNAALQDIRLVVEKKLALMLKQNPKRMDYYKKYQEIIADYNREKDRATVEKTFAELMLVARALDAEQQRAVSEGLTEDELALFDLLFRENISKIDRERIKQARPSAPTSLLAKMKRGQKIFDLAIQRQVSIKSICNQAQQLGLIVFSDNRLLFTEDAWARFAENPHR